MKKIILEQTAYALCHYCGHVSDHSIEVHSTLYFEPIPPNKKWADEFRCFYEWLQAKDVQHMNFNEAYIEYITEKLNK